MRKAFFALLAMACVCTASADICKSSDGIIVNAFCDLKECQGKLRKSVDSLGSIANNSFKETRDYYDKAFKDMQSSFSHFIAYTGIFITLLSLGSAFFNFKSVSNSKEKLKEEVNKSRNEIEKWFEKQKKELEIKVEEADNTMIKTKSYVDILFRNMADDYYKKAVEFFNKKDFLNYFLTLEVVYFILTKIDLDDRDLFILDLSLNLIFNYKNKNVEQKNIEKFANSFLNALKSFIEYCEDTKKVKHLKIAKETLDSLNEFLGQS